MRYRSKYDIYYALLNAMGDGQPMSLTKGMYHAFTTYKMMRRMASILVTNGLAEKIELRPKFKNLRFDDNIYNPRIEGRLKPQIKITEKGRVWVTKFKELAEFMDESKNEDVF